MTFTNTYTERIISASFNEVQTVRILLNESNAQQSCGPATAPKRTSKNLNCGREDLRVKFFGSELRSVNNLLEWSSARSELWNIKFDHYILQVFFSVIAISLSRSSEWFNSHGELVCSLWIYDINKRAVRFELLLSPLSNEFKQCFAMGGAWET